MLISPAVSSPNLRSHASDNGGILLTATDGTSNALHGASGLSRKRKREEDTSAHRAKTVFTIKPCHPSVHQKPQTFQPLHLIPRANLPLSALDFSGAAYQYPSSNLFTAQIQELEERASVGTGDCHEPVVLIARHELAHSLFAIERVSLHKYALCKLAKWVDVGTFQQNNGCCLSSRPPDALGKEGGDLWWDKASLRRTKHVSELIMKSTHLQRPQLSMQRPSSIPAAAVPSSERTGKEISAPPLDNSAPAEQLESSSEEPVPHLSVQECYDLIVNQYMETLYLSKTSLAYFAKGPLSRVRAAFSAVQDPSLQTGQLIDFVRSLLLNPAILDKKHLKNIPGIIRNTSASRASDAGQCHIREEPHKKRKSTKLKPGKDGIFPREEEYVSKWWFAEDADVDAAAGENMPQENLERKTSSLRLREILMQIILSLEAMALEKSHLVASEVVKSDDTQGTNESHRESNSVSNRGPEPNWGQELKTYVEVLVDKLCIWQSVEDDVRTVKQSKPERADGRVDPRLTAEENISSKLKSFCVEIIVPFYKSRLPDFAVTICKKLGVSSASSPTKFGSASNGRHRKDLCLPGSEIKRHWVEKARRPLQRVATEVSKSASCRPPSLTRSATDSFIPGLKTELDEVALGTVPSPPTLRRHSGRGGLPQSRKLIHREVDLLAVSTCHESKLKKKALVEEELRNAIAVLKKPNRGLAVKSYVDTAEQRPEVIGRRARKPANPMRNRLFDSILVDATPKRSVKSKSISLPTPTERTSAKYSSDDYVPQSSNPCVPSPAVRPQGPKLVSDGKLCVPGSTIRRPKATHNLSVEETPSRGSAKTVSYMMDGRERSVGADAERRELPQLRAPEQEAGNTPSKVLKSMPQPPAQSMPALSYLRTHAKPAWSRSPQYENDPKVYGTPVKKGRTVLALDSRDSEGALADTVYGTSIYENLGWDDGDYELK